MSEALPDRAHLESEYWHRGTAIKTLCIKYGMTPKAFVEHLISVGIRPKNYHWYKLNPDFEFSPEQASVLTGTLLGDACLAGSKKMWKLQLCHGSKQEAYLRWKMGFFQEMWNGHVYTQQREKREKPFTSYMAHTYLHPVFLDWRRKFYRDGRKHIPLDIEERLTPLAVAVWHMDDGCFCVSNSIWTLTMCTQCYRDLDVHRLRNAMYHRYGIALNIYKGQDGFILRSGRYKVVTKFLDLVSPFVPQCMRYKVETLNDCTPAPQQGEDTV